MLFAHFRRNFNSLIDSDSVLWCCAWNSNGKILATAGSDRNIRLYSIDNNNDERSHPTASALATLQTGHQKSVRSLSFAPRRAQLAAASFDGTVSIWTSSSKSQWTCSATVEGHENEVKAGCWASYIDQVAGEEQRFLATCGRDKTVWVWAVEESLHDPQDEDYECLAVMQEHDQDIKCLTWHPHVPLFLTGSYDESIRAWGPTGPSLDDWVPLGELTRSVGGTVWSLAFDSAGKQLAAALSSGQLILFALPEEWASFRDWNRREFRLFDRIELEKKKSSSGCGDCCKDSESAECCKNSDKSEATGCCKEPEASDVDNSNKASLHDVDDDSGCCGGGGDAMSSSQSAVVGCCSSKPKQVQSPAIPAVELFSLSWCPDGRFLVIATGARSLLIFDSVEGGVVDCITDAHAEGINCVSWNPQRRDIFASCAEDGTLKLWKFDGRSALNAA